MTVKLAHVCIETADLEVTENFYSLLGARRQFEFRNKRSALVGMYLAFDDNSFIEVIKVSKVQGEGLVRHFALEVDDLSRIHRVLKEHNIAVTDAVLEGDQTLMVTFFDPNGIFIECQEYTPDSMQLVGGVCEVDYEP